MRLSDFDYELPEALIAQEPAERRDASRLMILDRAARTIRHGQFADLGEWLRSGDRLVLNDTRVVPSRLFGVREGHTGKVELLLVEPTRPLEIAAGGWVLEAITRPARKLIPGTQLRMGESEVPVAIVAAGAEGRRRVRFPGGFDVLSFLEREGHLPLPPYIHRGDRPEDRERYQTVFAREQGAIAAPTAGLHFTPGLLESLEQRGIARSTVTLHVGPGTFLPVTVEDPAAHRMESEFCRVPAVTAEEINGTSAAGGRIVAVGTTVVRTLESLAVGAAPGWTEAPGEGSGRSDRGIADAAAEGLPFRQDEPVPGQGPASANPAPAGPRIRPGEAQTRAFIHPPYRFRCVDALVTNFHLPKSTLLMLVSAFAGLDLVREAYAEAVRERYRFYSYGDAMLVL